MPLFIAVVISSNVDQYLSLAVEKAITNPDGAQQAVYFFGFLSIISSLIFPVLLTLIALFAVSAVQSHNSLESFFKRYTNQVYIETLRAWGKTLLWSLLLILPGLWKYIEYIFVPFVVVESTPYQEGHEDALKASSHIVRKHFFKVLGVIALFHFFIPLLLTALFDQYRLLWGTPIASLALNFLDTYLLLFSTQLLFAIFQREVPHVADVQLEGR